MTPVGSESSTVATARLARWLSIVLGLPVVDSAEKARAEKSYRNLLVLNGPPAFCGFREELRDLVANCDNFVWIQQDYTCAMMSQLNTVIRKRWPDLRSRSSRMRAPILWTTVPEFMTEPVDEYINWNALTYDRTLLRKFPQWRKRYKGLLYYGAARANRLNRLEQLLGGQDRLVISPSSPAAQRVFDKMKLGNSWLGKMKLPEDLLHWRATVYLADAWSCHHYTSPANRFYECLSAGVAQIFDAECVEGFTPVGQASRNIYVVSRFAASTWEDVRRLERAAEVIAMEQRAMWGKRAADERASLADVVKSAYRRLP